MTLTPIQLAPGVVRDDPPYSSKPRWVDSQLVRFDRGRVRKIGGWAKYCQDVLTGKCRGLFSWAGNDGEIRLVAGTNDHLYAIVGGSAFDITPADLDPGYQYGTTGYGGFGSGGFGASPWGENPVGDFLDARTWSFAQFGEIPLCCPRGGKIYEWDLDTGSLATAVTNAPDINMYVLVTQERMVVSLGTIPASGSSMDAMLVRWSDQEDRSNWTPSSTTTSGEIRLTAGARIIAGSIIGRSQVLIWTDIALFSLKYIGDIEFVYGIDMIGLNCGLIGPKAFTVTGERAYWMSTSGQFYMYDGGSTREMPCPVRDYVFNSIPRGSSKAVICAGTISSHHEVLWFYPTSDVEPESTNYVKYNWQEDSWDVGVLTRTAWLDSGVVEHPLGVDDTSVLYQHETGTDADGAAMEAWIESAPFDINSGDRSVRVTRLVPDLVLTGTLDWTLSVQRWPDGPVEQTVTLVQSTSARLDTRIEGRQMAIRVSSDALGDDWRLGDVRLDMQPGARR